MESRGLVSLWAGTFKSIEKLQNYMMISYTEDGDALPSIFEKDFKIGHYDIDFREIDFYVEPSTNLKLLLEGVSYDDVIISRFLELYGENLPEEVNSIILLYNFKYS